MLKKTINKIIKSKMEDWLSSICDEGLVINLRKDIIVTGGSITSLFLNETVNDYDIYIRTRGTLLSLIDYYCKDKCEVLDGRNKDNYIDNLLSEYDLKDINAITSFYASTIRNLKRDQVSLWFGGESGMKFETNVDDKYQIAYLSPNAISFTNDVQVVIRFYGEPDVIHVNYDFVHATNYWTFDTGLVTNVAALECILSKELKYQGSVYPVTSVLRTKKFIRRGWSINAGEMFKIVYQTSLLDLTNFDVLQEQLTGMDVAYFQILLNALNDVTDKSKLTYEYVFALVDKIFNTSDSEN